MVFVGDWRTEEREDAVAGRLNDVAIVATHGVDRQLEYRVDDRSRLLGVDVFHELGGTLDVGEQSGHRLTLAVGRCRVNVASGLSCKMIRGKTGLRARLWRFNGFGALSAELCGFSLHMMGILTQRV